MTHGDDLRMLLDLEEIRQLKYAYFRCLDTLDWDGVAACFVPDATASYPDQDCADRDAILEFLTTTFVPDMVTMHHGHHPEIRVEGDRAHGTWYVHDRVYAPAHDRALEGAALHEDGYLRTHDGWRMSHTGYQRIFESTTATSGLTLKQGARSRGERPD
jgi:hypothetical protein